MGRHHEALGLKLRRTWPDFALAIALAGIATATYGHSQLASMATASSAGAFMYAGLDLWMDR